MIIDFHTHVFPPEVRDGRADYAHKDATFAEMYTQAKASIATSDDLLESMASTGVDASVACGFAWRDHENIVRHNDYLLEAAAQSEGRIIPFVTVNMAGERAEAEIARCAEAGARGIGELRPENQGWELNGESGHRLARLADEYDLPLLFHVTEEEGHEYPGKRGCSLASFREFALMHPGLTIIGAHLGGDIYRTPAPPDVFVDTAAVPFLHKPPQQPAVLGAVSPDRLLFASDFPLIDQARALRELREALPERDTLAMALGANAAGILSLTTEAAL
ncbi:MAG TPA: amidohydrolase family protein [Dehalococcoidia bacterium]|nr:amidohydrolase family protein [Dehalococcoidia bacterium]